MRSRARDQELKRPPPHLWVWYALGGKLPPERGTWVLWDTTCRTWILRHIGRTLTQVALPALLLLLVPVPLDVRITAAVGCTILSVLLSLAYVTELSEHRVVQAGYPSGTAAETRAQRQATKIPTQR